MGNGRAQWRTEEQALERQLPKVPLLRRRAIDTQLALAVTVQGERRVKVDAGASRFDAEIVSDEADADWSALVVPDDHALVGGVNQFEQEIFAGRS